MTVTRDQQLACIDAIADSYDPRLRGLKRERRRECGQYVCNHVAMLINSGAAVTEDDIKAECMARFQRKFVKRKSDGREKAGSALLTFLLFQAIWWFIQHYILNDVFGAGRNWKS